jgi:transcriptional/translational regulatory protein YebC/TACO1
VLVAALTAEAGRTRVQVRSLFKEHDGHLGAPGAVAYLFREAGVLGYAPGTDSRRLAQLAYAAGAEDVAAGPGGGVEVLTAPECLDRVRAHVASRGGGEPADAQVTWHAHARIPLQGPAARQMLQLLLGLERRDDVWSVYSNAEIPDEIVAEL